MKVGKMTKSLRWLTGFIFCGVMATQVHAVSHIMVDGTSADMIHEMDLALGPKCAGCGDSLWVSLNQGSTKLDIRDKFARNDPHKRHYKFAAYLLTDSSVFIQKRDSYLEGNLSSNKFTYYSTTGDVKFVSMNNSLFNQAKRLVHKDVLNSSVNDTVFYQGTDAAGNFIPFTSTALYNERSYGTLDIVKNSGDTLMNVDLSGYLMYRDLGHRGFRFVLVDAYIEGDNGEKYLLGSKEKLSYSSNYKKFDRKAWAGSYFDYEMPAFSIESSICKSGVCNAITSTDLLLDHKTKLHPDEKVQLQYKVKGTYAFDYTLERKTESAEKWSVVKISDEPASLSQAREGVLLTYEVGREDVLGPEPYIYRLKIDRIDDEGYYGKEYYTPGTRIVPLYTVTAVLNGLTTIESEDYFGEVFLQVNKVPQRLWNRMGYTEYGAQAEFFTFAGKGYKLTCWTNPRGDCVSFNDSLKIEVVSDTTIYAKFDKVVEGDYHVSIMIDSLIRKFNDYNEINDTTVFTAKTQPAYVDYYYGESSLKFAVEASNKKNENLYAVFQYSVNRGPWEKLGAWYLSSSNGYARNDGYGLDQSKVLSSGKSARVRVALCKSNSCLNETPLAVSVSSDIYVKRRVKLECSFGSSVESCYKSGVWFADYMGEYLKKNDQDTMWYFFGEKMYLKAMDNYHEYAFTGWVDRNKDTVSKSSRITLSIDDETISLFKDGSTILVKASFENRWIESFITPSSPLVAGATSMSFRYEGPFSMQGQPTLESYVDDEWTSYIMDEGAGLAPGKYRLKFKFHIPDTNDVKLMSLGSGYDKGNRSSVYMMVGDAEKKPLSIDLKENAYEDGDIVYYHYEFDVTGYTVTFLDGVECYAKRYANEGDFVVLPENPRKDGFDFDDWYMGAEEDAKKFVAEKAPAKDMSVYAKWTELSSSSEESSSSSEDPESLSSSSSSSDGKSSCSAESSSSEAASSSSEKTKSSSSSAPKSSSSDKTALVLASGTSHFNVAVNGRVLQIHGNVAGSSVAVMDMQGRVILTESLAGETASISVPRAGTYIVRVGGIVRRVNVQ